MTTKIMQKAAQALKANRYFEAERLAAQALEAHHDDGDYAAMAAVVPTLEKARHRRVEEALAAGEVTVVDEPLPEKFNLPAGCYLVQPPLVGADARRLRLAATEAEVPVAVVCREPLTQLRLQPLVAIAPGVTMREKVAPPQNMEAPELEWFIDALLAIGDAAIASVDPDEAVEKRVDAILARIDAIPEHEGLHRFLEETCLEAHETLHEAEANS